MEGDAHNGEYTIAIDISIHSLRMEGDSTPITKTAAQTIFQSTPSAWRETAASICINFGTTISIHSLRMEGDQGKNDTLELYVISIHSLRMEGDYRFTVFAPDYAGFQSTPSAWRETRKLLSA